MAKPRIVSRPATKTPKIKIREITEDERKAKTGSNHDEWKKVIQLALTKSIEMTCENYGEARSLASKLMAVRSYYGYAVKIQHRGMVVYMSPRQNGPNVELEVGDVIDGEEKKL